MDRLGNGLLAPAHAQDATVVAVELADNDHFALAVQPHPEAGTDRRLMEALLLATTPY